ncbi:hypothetical protein BD410DRAFT_744685 [Rickenella mellea]|uniref:CSN8/PSMD8/EIF3K domain-containing protein n=1 Tax=Rickenella mellea TaxID=50990 RepID=A0A4Y7QDI8_9AGAM|nr:hypothetical protein BD410DRAFT_744685 [Rickenella mellea]
MSNAPLTPPASENDVPPVHAEQQTPSSAPAEHEQSTPSVAPESSRSGLVTPYHQLFPSLVNLAVQGNYAEIIQTVEEREFNMFGNEGHESRFLAIAPLVLSYLNVNNLPPAHHALIRLPDALQRHPLYHALFNLLAATWEHSYTNIYAYSEQLVSVVQPPGFFDISLAAVVKGLVHAFIESFRKRTLALLSKSYTSVPLEVVQSYLSMPADLVLETVQRLNWTFDQSSLNLSPPLTARLAPQTNRTASCASTLGTFNDVANAVASLEGAL